MNVIRSTKNVSVGSLVSLMSNRYLMEHHRLTHQNIVIAEKIVDFFHARLGRDQVFDILAKYFSQSAADENLFLARLVHDFITAETQCVAAIIRAEFHYAVLLAVIDQVHLRSL